MTLAFTVFKKSTFQKMFHSNANLVGPTSPMLHTKSQDHWPSGSGEEDF